MHKKFIAAGVMLASTIMLGSSIGNQVAKADEVQIKTSKSIDSEVSSIKTNSKTNLFDEKKLDKLDGTTSYDEKGVNVFIDKDCKEESLFSDKEKDKTKIATSLLDQFKVDAVNNINSNKDVLSDDEYKEFKAKMNLTTKLSDAKSLNAQITSKISSNKEEKNKADAEKAKQAAEVAAKAAEEAKRLEAEKANTAAKSEQTTVPSDSSTASRFADAALGYLGVPYVWGGTSPSGMDCSGLVMLAGQSVGHSFSRTTYTQQYEGTEVSMSALKKGDLLFFGGNSPYHVAIYLGDGTFVHAPQPGDVVQITSISTFPPDKAVRVF